ncbi:hypothetical protein HMPREF0573_10250 [Mobiluncus curtisii ATCC 43063]|nr:hypothetical protein HMPREF0573_10250 [Mobiluncus curtisii ATCC 43063]
MRLWRSGGLIPASAGTTLAMSNATWASGAHPRECGDHSSCSWLPPAAIGSSPRVRGPLGFPVFVVGVGGLIPASAGTTRLPRRALALTWAHPRECGDHDKRLSKRFQRTGSSPRVRGPRCGTG